MQLYRVKYLKCLRTGKYNLKHKSEINLSLVWLFLAIVIFYLNCFDSGPCTPVLSTGNIYSLFFCPWLLDKQSTFHWYKMALLYLEKKNIYIYIYIYKKQYTHMWQMMIFFVSVGFKRTNRKTGKNVTLYLRELFKKIPRLGTFVPSQ